MVVETISAVEVVYDLCGHMLEIHVVRVDLAADRRISTLLVRSGLCKSQSDARKQIEQNAVSLGDQKITDPMATLSDEDLSAEGLLLKKGKKGFCRLVRG